MFTKIGRTIFGFAKALFLPAKKKLFDCRFWGVFSASEMSMNRFINSWIFLALIISTFTNVPQLTEPYFFWNFRPWTIVLRNMIRPGKLAFKMSNNFDFFGILAIRHTNQPKKYLFVEDYQSSAEQIIIWLQLIRDSYGL